MKPRIKGLLRKACRYGSPEGDIALYAMDVDPNENSHEYAEYITRKVWRKMGGKLPPVSTLEEGFMLVRISVEEV